MILRQGLTVLFLMTVLAGCGDQQAEGPGPVREVSESPTTALRNNPLETTQRAPLGAPPFHELRADDFLPALKSATADADRAIAEITASRQPAGFDNTLLALIEAERNIGRIARLWYGLLAVSDDPRFEELAAEMAGHLNSHQQRVLSDRVLYGRIETIHQNLAAQAEPEQARLAVETWRRFRRAGAHLDPPALARLGEIDSRLIGLDQVYSRARRAADHRHELLIEDEAQLAGLPDSLLRLAERSARDRGHERGWVFTLHAHSFYPFMRHFSGREQRRELYRDWMTRYRDRLRSDEDLGDLIERMAGLRAERAELLGFDSHLDYLLDDGTLSNRDQIETLLNRLGQAARSRIGQEQARLEALAAADGIEALEAWDWWYYRQRLLEARQTGDTPLVAAEWLSEDRVRDGLFGLANRLWGLRFHPRTEIPGWHIDVTAWEARDSGGETLGLLYLDLQHRPGKQGGAWTSHYRLQHHADGERVTPVLAIVANGPPATAGVPSLLSPEQTVTLFHEFGHALHGLLSNVNYAPLAGTNVAADFVEFPALLLERWALQPQILRSYASHHKSGALIDDAVIGAIQAQTRMTSGLETLEFIAAIELDLALHGARASAIPNFDTAERAVRAKLDLPAFLSPRHHGGGLASLFAQRRQGGDFRTLWSELLAADAFSVFIENGLMNRELAEQLRTELLSRGNSRDPMESWQAFRGRAPEIDALLESRGLVDDAVGEDPQPEANTPSGE